MGHWLPAMITGPWQEKGSEASPEADAWRAGRPALFWDRETWGRPSFDGRFSLGNSVFLRVSEAWDGMDSTYSSLQTIPSWLSNKHDEETKNSGMLVDVALQGRHWVLLRRRADCVFGKNWSLVDPFFCRCLPLQMPPSTLFVVFLGWDRKRYVSKSFVSECWEDSFRTDLGRKRLISVDSSCRRWSHPGGAVSGFLLFQKLPCIEPTKISSGSKYHNEW